MAHSVVGVVTGANKGIGLAIVRQLAIQYPESSIHGGSFLIYLTARDESRGEEALLRIHRDKNLKEAKALVDDGGASTVSYHILDVSDSKSIRNLAAFLKEQHPDGIDFVINNAAVNMEGYDTNKSKTQLGVKTTMLINYYGTLEVTRALIPLLKPAGRIVNVGSDASYLHKYSPSIRERFIAAKTTANVSVLMKEFTSAVERGCYIQDGWPDTAYAVSKAGLTGQTRALAHELREIQSDILINCCHPGWVQTDMSEGKGHKTPDQGAQTPVLLAIGDIGGRSGEFWCDEKVLDWTVT